MNAFLAKSPPAILLHFESRAAYIPFIFVKLERLAGEFWLWVNYYEKVLYR